jgi:threonine/homoserine/homoserine lactone efflux protein
MIFIYLLEGFTVVTGLQYWMRLAGGVLLLILGLYIFHSPSSVQTVSRRSNERAKSFFPSFFLALMNPMALFAFMVVFSIVTAGQIVYNSMFLSMLVAGVFIGSLSWLTLLTSSTHVFKKNITGVGRTIVNRIAGCLLMYIGFLSFWIGTTRY